MTEVLRPLGVWDISSQVRKNTSVIFPRIYSDAVEPSQRVCYVKVKVEPVKLARSKFTQTVSFIPVEVKMGQK
jgi:hypothetical protein